MENAGFAFFSLVLIVLFARSYGWGARSENRLKIGVLQAAGSVFVKFSRKRDVRTNHFRTNK